MTAISLAGVSKRFGAAAVLQDLDLTVPDGSLTAVLGASGSGKSTLLRLVAGFERVDSGEIRFGDRLVDNGRRGVRPQHRGVGYVPQDGALFPHLTVAGNVGFGLPRDQRSRVGELVELVGLTGLARRYPHQLSGGQQQRVALARALAIRPQVVLLDEPFSSLDAAMRGALRQDVVRILHTAGTTTVLVTHDQDEALATADRIALLRDGRIVANGSPQDLYRQPPDLLTATSIGETNVVTGIARGDVVESPLGPLKVPAAATLAVGETYRVVVRPDQLLLHPAARAGAVAGAVGDVQFYGHDAIVAVVLAADRSTVLARVPGTVHVEPGQQVWVEVTGPALAWSAG
jgi:iron(III) transport system ATP-binding protein